MQTNQNEPRLPLEAPVDWQSQVPTVSELTRRLRGHIESAFFDVWVRGEVSNFRKPVSGHAYFILKDGNAQLRAVMFRHNLSRLKFQIQDGIEVLLHGTLTVYEARGEYQIVPDRVEPVGIGALQLAFEQLKAKLQKEGLFDPKHKKPLPLLPKRVGIVTSATGAAVKDILKVLGRRFYNLECLVIPASVQGEKAAGEICQAIHLAERWNKESDRPIDVLMVGRGGGSIEDLWPFNEESVARKIFQCPIPIISAVGHEIDFTIADFVADVRAPTPSAAAEMVTASKIELVQKIRAHFDRCVSTMLGKLNQSRLHLGHLSKGVRDPRERIRKIHESFNTLLLRLIRQMRTHCLFTRKRMESALQMLHTLSPLQVIGRGYSITSTESGEIIRSIAVCPGTVIQTRLSDGILSSEVLPKGSSPR